MTDSIEPNTAPQTPATPPTTPTTSTTTATETPFFWWELNNEQKLKRTIMTAPLAPGGLAAWDLLEGRPINVLGVLVASAGMLVMIALYWWRVRDERDAVADRSVLNAPVVDADARTGFLALAVAPFTMLGLMPLHFVKLDMTNAASLAPFRDALELGALVGAPFAIATIALVAKALLRPSTTAARRAAFVAVVGVVLAAGAWGVQLRTAQQLQAMRAIVTTRGAPQLIMPERWEQLATGEAMVGTTTSWASTVYAQALVAARVGSINDDVDQRGCEVFTQSWARGVMKLSNITITSTMTPAPTAPGTRERCRFTFMAREPDGTEAMRTIGAIGCPRTGGAIVYVSAVLGDESDEAARALQCLNDP